MNRSPILRTKLYKPEINKHYVFRDKIVKSLDANRDKPLTLVVAATGYGKSVTISEWLDYSKIKYCWISIDKDLDDLRTFLEYLTYGIDAISKNSLPELKGLLEGEELPPEKVICNTLINELDEIQEELVLVLDDYNIIKNHQIHDLINELIKYFPRKFHLIIISRIDPPLNLSTLKSFGKVNEIRMTELSFDTNELSFLSKNLIGRELNQDIGDMLLQKTDGWIIGLRLALNKLTQGNELENPLDRIKGDKNFLTQYLLNEVFLQLNETEQHLLLIASCFERFSKDLLKYVTGGQGNKKTNEYHTTINNLFDKFKTASLFLIPLDEDYEWFRFHHFFRDFLLNHLSKKSSAEEITENYKSGSKYFYSNDFFEEAIYLAVKSNNVNLIVKIFEQNKYKLLNYDKFNLLWKWISIIPEEIIIAEPHLIVTRALLHDTKADFLSMQNDLVITQKLLEENTYSTKQKKQISGEYHAVHCSLSFISGNIQDTIEHLEKALKLLSKNHFYFNDFALGYGAFAINSARGFNEAISRVNDYINELPASYTLSRMRGMIILSLVQAFHGNLKEMLNLSILAQPIFLNKNQWVSFSYANYLISQVYYQWNELDKVIQYVDQVEEHQYAGRPHWILNCLYTKAFTLLAQGNYEELKLTLLKLKTFAQDYKLESSSMMVKTFEVELALRQNNIEKALKVSEGVNFEVYPPVFYFFFSQLTYIKLKLSKGDDISIDEANERLEKLIELGRSTGRVNLLTQALPLQSLIWNRKGDEKKAINIIEEALSISEPGGFIRSFLDLGKPMEILLQSVYKKHPDNNYLKRILKEFAKEKRIDRVEVILDYEIGITETLSTREIELLKLVAKGLQNKEIAEKLYLSLDSIKKYLYYIYQKLGVKNRVAAIAKANELHLIN